MARNFSISDFTKVKVFNNAETPLCYNITISKRLDQSSLKHIVFTLKEWRTLASQLPTLVATALKVHHDHLRGKTPSLHESRHIISSRYLTLLSCSSSSSSSPVLAGTSSIVCILCPYQTRDSVDVTIPTRGVALAFDELMALSECSTTINKYIALSMSSSKVISLREPADVLYLQTFCQNFFDDENARRVRIILEKPELPETAYSSSSSSSSSSSTDERRGKEVKRRDSPTPLRLDLIDRDEVDGGGGGVDGGGSNLDPLPPFSEDEEDALGSQKKEEVVGGGEGGKEEETKLKTVDTVIWKEGKEVVVEEEEKEEEVEEEEEREITVRLHNPDRRFVSTPLFT